MQLCCQQTSAFTFLECSKTQEEVAEDLGVSVRTIQNLSVKAKEHSLNRHQWGYFFLISSSSSWVSNLLICRPALLLPAEKRIGDIAVAIWTRALFQHLSSLPRQCQLCVRVVRIVKNTIKAGEVAPPPKCGVGDTPQTVTTTRAPCGANKMYIYKNI